MSTGGLAFGILGPLEMRRHGEPCRVGRRKTRQLLATLLLHPNTFVAVDLLTDVLWGEGQPRSAAANLRTYVHELRDSCAAVGGSSPIRTHDGGYSVDVRPHQLDSMRFQASVAEVERRRAAGDEAGALRVAEEAYALWRASPLDDLPIAPAWQVGIDRLEHTRRELLDLLTDLWMRHGKHERACGLLRERIDEEPYAEPLWARYVGCLVATGRRAEARAAAREVRGLLADELGTEPGAELRRMEERLDAGGSTRHAPCQLPFDVADFTGRARELERLREPLTASSAERPLVAVLSGPPGVGKTTLAVHLGHLLREEFPDGQLFLDLRATSHPRRVASALGELLHGLGAAVPSDADQRAATLRAVLADRRVLVLLDDAASARQAAPLLPGSGASAVVVTSRRRLSDLAGVVRCAVGELDDGESTALLAAVAGAERSPLPRADTEAILQACGRLPLAIRVAGSRLQQRSDLSASVLADRLVDERRRLDELRIGDLAVRASADLSYRMLSDAETRLYHVLGLLGVGELPAWLLDESGVGPDSERALDALVEANLVQVTGTDAEGRARYRIHDLLRCHAYERALATARERARDDLVAVLTLFLDRSVWHAGRMPFRFLGVTVDPPARAPAHADDVPPMAWFDAHRQLLAPLVYAAAAQGATSLAGRLAASWAPYLDLRSHHEDWDRANSSALACTTEGLDRAVLLRNRGQLALYRDDFVLAETSFAESYELFATLPHWSGAGVAAVGLGTCRRLADDHDGALTWYQRSLDHFDTAADRSGEAVARNAIGGVWLRLGEPDAAERWLRTALDLCVQTGDKHREALVRRRIARLREQQGDGDAAVTELRAALDLLTKIGDDRCAATVRRSLGPRLAKRGDLTTARRMLVVALDVGHRLADARGEALAADHLAQLYTAMGEPDSARRCHRRADRAWRQVAEPPPAPTRPALAATGGDPATG